MTNNPLTDKKVLEFRLPDLGEGLTDAELVSWRVAVGDTVALNEILAEVETAKALVELPSPFAGEVAELLAAPGDTVPVGAVIIRIGTAPAQQEAVLVGYGPDQDQPLRRRRPPAPVEPAPVPTTRPDAKPSARRLAKELGVELIAVTGTGHDGAITAADVAALRPGPTPETAAPETRTKVSGVRKRTADAMALSARTVPTVTEFLTVDVTASMRVLDQLRDTPSFGGLKLTPLALVAKVVLVALAEHPEMNSSWDDERGEIVTKHYVNLGIAVAAPRGLLVPNIKAAHRLNLRELCRDINSVAEVARRGDATPADLLGGTFTITNVGVFGVDAGTPIVNSGEAAILCLGAIRTRPWVVADRIEPRLLTTLGVSFDHRLVDGEQGSRFLTAIGALLEDPLTLLSRV